MLCPIANEIEACSDPELLNILYKAIKANDTGRLRWRIEAILSEMGKRVSIQSKPMIFEISFDIREWDLTGNLTNSHILDVETRTFACYSEALIYAVPLFEKLIFRKYGFLPAWESHYALSAEAIGIDSYMHRDGHPEYRFGVAALTKDYPCPFCGGKLLSIEEDVIFCLETHCDLHFDFINPKHSTYDFHECFPTVKIPRTGLL